MGMSVATRPAIFSSSTISTKTQRAPDFIDITDEVMERIIASGLTQGIAVITSQHTTASIVVNEHEPELLKDLTRLLDEIAPQQNGYGHNGVHHPPPEQPNGHAHCQALMLNSSASIPIIDGQGVLGRYQRIFLVELDCPRPRQVTLSLLGT